MQLSRRSAVLGAGTLALATPFVRPARAATAISFRLDWAIYGSHAPFFLALEDKLFEKAGLDVSIGEGQGSATVAKIVGQGNDPIGFIDFTSTIRAVEQGIPLMAIGRVISNVMCVISHADAAVKSPKELEGKVVAYAPSESTGQMMPALLQRSSVNAANVNVLNPATGAKNAVFLRRRADAIPANVNVQIAQLEEQGAKLSYFLFSDFGVEMMNNGIVANANWLQQNHDAAKAFVRVSIEAFKAAKADPDKAVDLLIKRLPHQARNKSVLRRQLDLTFPSLETHATKGKPLGVMVDEDWRGTQELLVKYGGLAKSVDTSKLYTNQFVEA
ncbi:ABC transporter substrate-binding protein [Reyranella sp. CPCC 100927]|uniref:ABC transporter substrate-binding protein n=1 Tax=Reyranella sp. CPCC 100927 TaxID=2599616 RepID=UPI0011B68514|nr:ABC transporter substrate-binding protein [Reyranella sp. CPCC 100927]TWS95687.1 ABC transporter substrate-binding protein [Reyranella sp. CPCC 100927]